MYSAGASNQSFEQATKEGFLAKVSEHIGLDRAKVFWELGRNEYTSETKKTQDKALGKVLGIKEFGSGVVIDSRTDKSDTSNMEFLNLIAKFMGKTNINVVDDNSTIFNKGDNAKFVPSESTIYVRNGNLKAVFHELAELTDFYNSKGYETLRQSAMEWMARDLGNDKLDFYLNGYKDVYSDEGHSYLDASREMVNDYIVAVLKSGKGSKALAERLAQRLGTKEARTFGQKLKNWISNVKAAIQKLFGDSQKATPFMEEVTASVQNAEEVVNAFVDVLEEATKVQEAASKGELKGDAESDAEVRKSKEMTATYELIDENTPTKERYEILKNQSIIVHKIDSDIDVSEYGIKENKISKESTTKLIDLAKKLGIINKPISTNDVTFEFSTTKMRESIHKQSNVNMKNSPIKEYAEMLHMFDKVVEDAVLIERHADRYASQQRDDNNLGMVHVLVSAYENSEGIVPVKLLIKEFLDNRQNKLHVAIVLPNIKTAEIKVEYQKKSVESTNSAVKYSLSKILEIIKKDYSNDKNFGKYIPWQFGYKNDADIIDSEYLDALKEDNLAKAKLMVKKAAKLAGYTQNVYHGTRYSFTEFDRNKQGTNTGTEISKGWFFAADKETANSYYPYGVMKELEKQNPKMFNAESLKPERRGNLYEFYLKPENSMEVDAINYDYSSHREKADAWMEYVERAYKENKNTIVIKNAMDNQLKTGARESTVYMFRNPNQVKSADPITYDNEGEVVLLSERFDDRNNDFRYSKEMDADGRALSKQQAEFFKDSKVRDENGNLKVVYHGTARADRVGYIFDPNRATSGPMAYFTDNKEVATNYSRDKQDTSLSRDSDYDSYYTQFKMNVDGKDMSIAEAWGKLPISKRVEIRKKAPHVTFDDEYENIIYDENRNNGLGNFDKYLLREHHENYLEALVDAWLEQGDLYGQESRFKEVLSLVGIDDVQYLDPDYREEKVYETYLNITNPLRTQTLTNEFADELEEWWRNADQSKYDVEDYAADMWDKTSINVDRWISRLREDIAEGTTHSWTTIPDAVTDFLKEKGYDGIEDKGGKNHETEHTVYIPFYSEQIKDVNNENPTENIDIRYSKEMDSAFEFMLDWEEANEYAKLKGKLKGETDETIDIMYEDAQNGMSLDEYVAIIGKEYIFGAETRDYCRIDDIARIYKVVCYRRQGGVRSVSKILLYAELKSGEKVFLANLDINGGADGQMLMITTAVLDKNPRAIIDC